MNRPLLIGAAAAVLLAGTIALRWAPSTETVKSVPQPVTTRGPSATPASTSGVTASSEPTSGTPSAPAVQPAPPSALPVCAGTPAVTAERFSANDPQASYCGPGRLVPGSGTGVEETTDWAPAIRFPLDRAPAYANSQVWGVGGTSGPPGGQGDRRNYSYPWHDDFCETRGYATVMCPSGRGHQGQDIRPAACCDAQGHLLQDTFLADAVEDGRITSIGTYTVYLAGVSGRLYRYLHMDMGHLLVREGDQVTRGQHIGYVSNAFGRSVTTFHLHFEIKAPVSVGGHAAYTWVPSYPSLVASYARLLDGTP